MIIKKNGILFMVFFVSLFPISSDSKANSSIHRVFGNLRSSGSFFTNNLNCLSPAHNNSLDNLNINDFDAYNNFRITTISLGNVLFPDSPNRSPNLHFSTFLRKSLLNAGTDIIKTADTYNAILREKEKTYRFCNKQNQNNRYLRGLISNIRPTINKKLNNKLQFDNYSHDQSNNFEDNMRKSVIIRRLFNLKHLNPDFASYGNCYSITKKEYNTEYYSVIYVKENIKTLHNHTDNFGQSTIKRFYNNKTDYFGQHDIYRTSLTITKSDKHKRGWSLLGKSRNIMVQPVVGASPDCVKNNLNFWFKADVGISIIKHGSATTTWLGQASKNLDMYDFDHNPPSHKQILTNYKPTIAIVSDDPLGFILSNPKNKNTNSSGLPQLGFESHNEGVIPTIFKYNGLLSTNNYPNRTYFDTNYKLLIILNDERNTKLTHNQLNKWS